jgi:hypothetical protein
MTADKLTGVEIALPLAQAKRLQELLTELT